MLTKIAWAMSKVNILLFSVTLPAREHTHTHGHEHRYEYTLRDIQPDLFFLEFPNRLVNADKNIVRIFYLELIVVGWREGGRVAVICPVLRPVDNLMK